MGEHASFVAMEPVGRAMEKDAPATTSERKSRKVPELSAEWIALFSGIEKSERFTAEAAYDAFCGVDKKEQG